MRHYLLLPLVVLMLLASCGGNKQGQAADVLEDSLVADTLAIDSLESVLEQNALPKAADELFDDFIFNFAANRRLQMERIAFPLPVDEGERHTKKTKSQWLMEHFFMHQGYYTLLFDDEQQMEVVKDTTVSSAIVEKIFFADQRVQQYVFSRQRGLWMLTRISTIPIAASSNASFLMFYHQFASDAGFQAAHLAKTVHFSGPNPDDDFDQMEGIITPDTWEAFAPTLPSKMIYNIIYGHPRQEGQQKVFVMRGIANGLEMELTFKRKGDTWKLTKLTT